MHHTKTAAGEPRIAAALFFGGALDQGNLGSMLGGSQSGAQCGVASSDNNNVIRLILHPTPPVAGPRPRIVSLMEYNSICGFWPKG